MEVPVCDGTLSAPGGVLTCSGAWVPAAAARLSMTDAEVLSGAILFVLALAFGLRSARRAFFKGDL